MKKSITYKIEIIFLVVSIVLSAMVLASCGEKNSESYNGDKDTILIYMVGSDLEARSGAGTDDLKEIEESGVDLNRVNVLVYAGGTPKWHNDITDEQANAILELKADGFQKVSTSKLNNMGESDTLLEFLNYGYDNYKSKSFSLIMWDHGNGPIIGYGKDMLFENDSLTLSEMNDAMARSPFNSDNKLAWVGFDACLMSSAELACIWDDYADYLIASQEVEPSFGWNYAFLKDYNKIDITELLPNIIDDYIDSCIEYYEKRNYENRDTTLSCIDLSHIADLEQAINKLFDKANSDIDSNYNLLVSKRVNTRAFGRASTGSEYDLIDIKDMAEQLKDLYPNEAEAVCLALEKAVFKNGTNTDKSCGLSIYYPFYNKYHYEVSWKDTYGKLNVFDSYKIYLDNYQSIWLSESDTDSYVSENKPYLVESDPSHENKNDVAGRKYCLNLTKEQNETFAKARYYILNRISGDIYFPVFACNDVSNNGGVLSASFEGKAIYIKNKYNNYYLPIAVGYDTIGDVARYSINAWGKNSDNTTEDTLEFQIALDNKTDKVSLTSLTLDEANKSEAYLGSGRSEDREITDWDSIQFLYGNFSYLTRNDNGTIAPLSSWTGIFAVDSYEIDPKDGIEFTYSSLDDGDYYIIFEITDTKNNKYCSEPLAIDVENDNKAKEVIPEEVNLKWKNKKKLKVYDDENLSLYLSTTDSFGNDNYTFEAKNNTDDDLMIYISDITINSNISVSGNTINLKPNETADAITSIVDYTMLGNGLVDKVTNISFTFSATKQFFISTGDLVVNKQKVNVSLSGDAVIDFSKTTMYNRYEFSEPFLSATASEQVLLDNSQFKITLNKFGDDDIASFSKGYFTVENKTNQTQYISLEAYSANGVTLSGELSYETILPNCRTYIDLSLSEYKFENYDITAIENLKICFGFFKKEPMYITCPDKIQWVDVALDKKGNDTSVFKENGNIIFNQNGVRVLVNSFETDGDTRIWYATIINDSETDISMCFEVKDEIDANAASTDTRVGAHQRRNIEFHGYGSVTGETLVFRPIILDFAESTVLYSGSDYITLTHN